MYDFRALEVSCANQTAQSSLPKLCVFRISSEKFVVNFVHILADVYAAYRTFSSHCLSKMECRSHPDNNYIVWFGFCDSKCVTHHSLGTPVRRTKSIAELSAQKTPLGGETALAKLSQVLAHS
jgi:hypothetical protein